MPNAQARKLVTFHFGKGIYGEFNGNSYGFDVLRIFWLIIGNFQKLLSYFKMCTLTFSILFQHQPCVSGEISTR